jgi:hypothetical protein
LPERRLPHDGENTVTDWLKKVEDAAEPIAEALDADIIFFNGQINPVDDRRFIEMCRARTAKRKNVVLVLTTPGGDAHAAYKIARCLQRCWKSLTVFVPGWCKSAGTLVAIGAHKLVIGDLGELGPIDVQRGKADELWEMNSGLVENAAFQALETAALKMFADYLFHIKEMSQGQVTFKTASDVAVKMIVGQLEPVYAQIDPLKIGENTRAMQIAEHYGSRLNLHSENLCNRDSLEALVTAYSSHAFVIDRLEAKDLFKRVSEPDQQYEALCEAIGEYAYIPIDQLTNQPTIFRFINRARQNENQQQQPDADDQGPPKGHEVNTGGAVGAAEIDSSTQSPVVRSIRASGEAEAGAA